MEFELKRIMEAIPANIFFKDTQARYQLVTKICGMLNGEGEGKTIIGKTDLEVQPDHELGRKFYQEDLELVRNGGEIKYLQKMTFGETDYYYQITKHTVQDAGGSCIGIVGMVEDVTENVLAQQKLEEYSYLDEMTGVYNRSYYERHLKSLKADEYPVAVIMADCNDLKFVNDHYGHEQGDYLLVSTVNNIRRGIRSQDKIFRMGGDEFLVLCPKCNEKGCEALIRRIRKAEKEISINGTAISTSYGYAILSDESGNLEDAIKKADEMMYQEKKRSKIRDEEVRSREQYHIQEKNQIAAYVAGMIEAGDIVYLDAGTTTGRVIHYLDTENVTFVTNSPSHARKLARLGYVTHMLGSELKASTEAVVGEHVIEDLEHYHFTKGFFGCNGVDADGALLTPEMQEARVKQAALRRCNQKYVLCDSSKFSQIASEKFADMSEVSVITNEDEKGAVIR